jgi:hypothetical protein
VEVALRGFMAALGAVLVCATTLVGAAGSAWAKEAKEFEVGQWAGFVFSDNNTGQFIDCTAWAYNDNSVQVGISINKNWNLDLWLNSDAWNLPDNQTYPISYWVDRNAVYRGKAATDSEKFVKIEVERGQAVFDELKSGNQLTFRTQNDDYVFSLSGSSAALNRLLDCVNRYSKTASTNPFDGGSGAQPESSSQESQPGPEANQQAGSGAQTDSSAVRLDPLTQSVDQVRQFLVDATGAKPSMITVAPEKFKSGKPYYYFSTPIGEGQFWQEQLGNDVLRNVVLDYLAGYKEECKGAFEQNVTDVVQGERGETVLGVATCSSSTYQDNGPEVLSYSITALGDVITIYTTYVGGNAAKAKTDSLGKLIARRSEDLIR